MEYFIAYSYLEQPDPSTSSPTAVAQWRYIKEIREAASATKLWAIIVAEFPSAVLDDIKRL